jgi:hypothetical protein
MKKEKILVWMKLDNRRKDMKKTLSFIFIALFFITSAYALEVNNHKILNEYIARQNFDKIDFSLDSYLKDKLRVPEGIDGKINSLEIFAWLGEGGIQEDLPEGLTIPYARSFNHFHDPLTNQGFSDLSGVEQLDIKSSVIWSQLPIGEQYFGDYSWHDVRNYFYLALTTPEKQERDEHFSDMFRGLGQLMHLVEDASVPDHTRNDAHVFRYPYEKWAKANIGFNPSTEKITIAEEPLEINNIQSNFFAHTYLLQTPGDFAGAEVPIAHFIDTNQYSTATDPAVTLAQIDGFSSIGLSEYTNANFLSADKMCGDYPYPKAEHCEIRMENPPDDGLPDLDRKYLSSTNGHPGEQLEHLAVVSYVNYYREQYFPHITTAYLKLGLDPACHKEYAQKLIPKAVGYAAGFIKYFFRGDINLILDQENNDLGYVIENNSEEEISGNFKLYYDAADGFRKMIWSRDFTLESKQSTTGGNRSENISFGVEEDAEEPGRFILAFKGTLGQEIKPDNPDDSSRIGAVAGQVVASPAMKITVSDEGVYSLSDMDATLEDPMTHGFDRIALQVKNISEPGMDMTGGTIRLGVKYRLGLGNQFQNNPPDPSDEFYYIHQTLSGPYEIPRDQPLKLEFDLSDSPIPLYATDVYLYVVYEGTIGEEIGKCLGFVDVSEPTPLHIQNYMNKVCLYGDLYEAGSLEALGLIDPGQVDAYAHDLENIFIKFWPPGYTVPAMSAINPSATNNLVIPYLAAGEYKVIYFLGDPLFRYSVTTGKSIKTDDRDGFSHTDPNEYQGVISFNSIINQYEAVEPEDPSYVPGGENTRRDFPQKYFQAINIDNYYLKDNHIIQYPVDSSCILE